MQPIQDLPLQVKIVLSAIGILIMLVCLAFGGSAQAATPNGFPVDLQVISSAKPGSLKIGSRVTVRLTVRNTGTQPFKLQVGILGAKPPLNSSRKLSRPVPDLSVWSIPALGKKPQTLVATIEVVPPPPEAAGAGGWCVVIVAAPSLMKGPPAWTVEERLCYGIKLP